jgi:hypothetical protein
MYQHSVSHRLSTITVFCAAFCCAYLAGCTSAMAQRTEEVVVAPIGDEGEVTSSAMTREELEDQLRRYSDRHYTRVFLAANTIIAGGTTPELYLLMQEWKRVSLATVVEIAIGPNAVTNLLDMVVVTTLSRMVVEDYWVPERIGDEIGQDLITAYRILEEDIWSIADAVLTADQQEDLRILINEWRENNTDQSYPWHVRLSEFSGQRAARLNSIKKSGGLLKEVAEAREAAEELQDFGERMLFYLQRAPVITSTEFENSILGVLGSPEMTLILEDTDRFVGAVEELVEVIDQLPSNRLAAVDQLMERVSEERQIFLQDLSDAGPNLNKSLNELRQTIESFERIVNALNSNKNPQSEPFDIGQYHAFVAEAGKTATELQPLAQALGDTLDKSSALLTVIDQLAVEQSNLLDRIFWLAVALIFIFFCTMLLYRYLVSRILPT